jgi:AraC-like DNA-binding protein
MNTYRELAPVPGLGLDCVWTQPTRPAGLQRVVPDGCIDIIWSRSDGMLEVAGPDTRARMVPMAEDNELVAVRFLPGRAPAVLGIPADALRDTMVPLEDLWGAGARALSDALAEDALAGVGVVKSGGFRSAGGDGGRAATGDRAQVAGVVLQRAVATRARPADRVAGATAVALRGPASVADTADRLGLSERQLRRRCLAAFGYGPKTLQRILRFQRALVLARSGVPLADTAIAAGYADQAHLSNEVRRLAGAPLGDLT